MEQGVRYVDSAKAVNFDIENVKIGTATYPNSNSLFNINCEYINGLSRNLTVVTREGLKIEIPPIINNRINDLIIRVTISHGRAVNLNIENLLSSTAAPTRLLVDVLQNGDPRTTHGIMKYTMDYTISVHDIESNGGSLYLNNLDVVISTLNNPFIPYHPYSEIGVRNKLVEEDETINDIGSFGYALRIVDSLGKFGTRYVNVNNQVYKVPVVRKSNLPDGVYLTSSGPVSGDISLAKPVSVKYSFEEADSKLSLYKTSEDAKTLGDQFAESEKELKRLAISLKEREAKLKEEKLIREDEFDRRKLEMERLRQEDDLYRKQEEARLARKVSALKEEISELEHKRSIEMINRKDEYERKSMDRKDSSEMIKFLPLVVTGIAAAFVAYSKITA